MKIKPNKKTPYDKLLITPNYQAVNNLLQHDTIFAIEDLNQSVVKLTKTIKSSSVQSQRLEESNMRLQKYMLVLTFITTLVVIYSPLEYIFKNLILPFLSYLTNIKLDAFMIAELSTAFAGILSALISLFTSKREKEIIDKIRFTDNSIFNLSFKNIKIKDK